LGGACIHYIVKGASRTVGNVERTGWRRSMNNGVVGGLRKKRIGGGSFKGRDLGSNLSCWEGRVRGA